MSYSLKGFMQLSASLSNTPSTIAAFGELSNRSLTYSRSQKVYVDADPTKFTLRAFSTKSSDATVEVPDVIKTKLFEVTDWINSIQNSVNAYNTKTAFLNALTTQFGISLTGINCGDMVEHAGVYFPTWIGYVQLGIPNTQFYSDNQVKIWFADTNFQAEYDENEIIIVPPVLNLEALWSSKTAVEASLTTFRNINLLQQITAAKNGISESELLNESYLWKDPSNPNNTLDTIWTVVLYGRLDGNSDYIKDAIRTYIAANSSRTENQWKTLLPDIYLNTEFYVFPRWNNMSIPEMNLTVGQYSPIINLKKELNHVKGFFTLATATHIENYLAALPFQMKSLCALFISGPDNRDNIFNIRDVFPDYMNVPTTEILFNMQSTKTKDWVQLMVNALVQAETVGQFDALPSNMRKVTRNNIMYVVFKYDNIEYLVATKKTIPGYTS